MLQMLRATRTAPVATPVPLERPRLDLSGPRLALAFESLVNRGEDLGGIERYVEAITVRAAVFREALVEADPAAIDSPTLRTLCALMPTVRRRVSEYLQPERFPELRSRIATLMAGRADTTTTDARIAAFCDAFPDDRAHRWVRDLAAELLHGADPERYPLMCRWVWDARTNTGALREMWYGEDIDHIMIDVADRYGTFLMLREELSQFLANNGVFRDVMQYVDLLSAQVYANYIGEQGGSYLRVDFASPVDPMIHTRRLLGLDGVDAQGRTRLRVADGHAHVVPDVKLLD